MSKFANVYRRLVLIEKFLFKKNTLELAGQIRGDRQMFRPVPVEQEPKRKSRFVIEFPKEFEIESYWVQKITKPKLNIHYDWCDIEIKFIDVIGPSTSRKIYDLARICRDKKKEQKDNLQLFDFTICQLDPVGCEIERWVIEVQDIEIDFGNLDYFSDELSEVNMKVIPRDCILVY